MLDYLKLRNFRAFRQVSFDFSRINIFVGPNNSGKSSALSAINLLAQTINANESGSPLLLRGKYDDLGTYIDAVHGNIPRTIMSIEFGNGPFRFSIDFKYRTQRREIEIVKYEIKFQNQPIYSYKVRKDAYDVNYGGRKSEQLLGGTAKRRPQFRGIRVFEPNLNQIRFGETSRNLDLFEDPIDIKGLQDIARKVARANHGLMDTFRVFDSLSPFREQPQRTFLFSGESPREVGRTGDKAVDILVSDNFARGRAKRGFVDQVSKFFKSSKMAQNIEVKALTSRHFELCLVGNDGSSHNICDVGFGCSQVLPVLVGGLNLFLGAEFSNIRNLRPIYVVQEPEIHLHPNAQADLGTFFVELVKDYGQIFIETHSDNLILRIQRHVAEKIVDPKHVRVFFVDEQNGEKKVTRLDLDGDGVFNREWPGGFFPQRQQESFELARAAAPKNQ